MEKELHLKTIIVIAMSIIFAIAFFGSKTLPSINTFSENKKIEEKVNVLLEEYKDYELIAKEEYNNFIYLSFQNGEDVVSYFLNSKTGEEIDFKSILKPGMEDEFERKVEELLALKYPDFIVNAILKENVKRIYQIRDNELILTFDGVETNPIFTEKLYLRINYNEIKDYLDFTFLLDSEYENEDGYNYDKSKKTIALTFDDGPSGEKTNRIVEALSKNKAHATFFMVGNRMKSSKSVIENVLNHGNEIGSHSYAHKNMARQKLQDVIADTEKTNEIYKSITGKDLIYTRPPYGSITKEIKESLDTIFITWNLDTEDWLHRNKDYIVNYVMENVSDGDIILMHDSYNSTVEAVEELLPKLYANGYQVVSVSELANLKGRTLETHTLYRSLKEV